MREREREREGERERDRERERREGRKEKGVLGEGNFIHQSLFKQNNKHPFPIFPTQ